MFNILSALQNNLQTPSAVKTKRIFTHNPSSAMCYSALDNTPIGSCIRSSYLNNKEFPKSNPMGIYVQMTAEAGKLWESWLINQYKELGIYVDHSVRFYDDSHNISGELDILHMNPETDRLEITECKQYNGSNFYAQNSIVGTSKQRPTPKDGHLLQCVDYLLMCKNTDHDITHVNLLYLDRSCGSYSNNFQFRVSLTTLPNKEVAPLIEYYDFDKKIQSYIDNRITEKAIYEKNEMLDTFLENELIPPRDFTLKYTDEKIELLFRTKQISANKYNKWKENPNKNFIGDWNCVYCPFGPDLKGFSTCWSLNE